VPQRRLRLLLDHKILLSVLLFHLPPADAYQSTAGAIIFTIIAIFSVFSYFGYRSLIPFASLVLQVVMDISKHHKSVYVVAFTALFVQAALAVCVFSVGRFSLLSSLLQMVRVYGYGDVRLTVTHSNKTSLTRFILQLRQVHARQSLSVTSLLLLLAC
jgi:hypothetical protein